MSDKHHLQRMTGARGRDARSCIIWYQVLYYPMPETLRFLDFVHLPSYTRSAKGLMTDHEQRDLGE